MELLTDLVQKITPVYPVKLLPQLPEKFGNNDGGGHCRVERFGAVGAMCRNGKRMRDELQVALADAIGLVANNNEPIAQSFFIQVFAVQQRAIHGRNALCVFKKV